MYKLLILFIFFSTCVVGQGNIPVTNQATSTEKEQEEVEIEREEKSLKLKEASAQQKVIQTNVSQLYRAISTISFSTHRKSPTAIQQEELEKHLKSLEKLNNESFEYHLFNYKVGNYDFSRIESLQKAAKLKPNDITVLKELSAYAHILNNDKALKKHLSTLNSMRVFSKDLELLANNLLQSLPKNTVLITHGANDTYPLLIQQKIKNVRQDVEIISLEHLQSMDYRKRLKKEGIKMPKSNIIDTDFFGEFIQLNKTKNIVVAPSVPRFYIEKGEQINTVGLGYTMFGAEQNEFNKSRYENGLKNQISNHVVNSKGRNPMLSNYLPFLFEVRNQYVEDKNVGAIDEIENLLLRIAKLSNKQTQVKALLNK